MQAIATLQRSSKMVSLCAQDFSQSRPIAFGVAVSHPARWTGGPEFESWRGIDIRTGTAGQLLHLDRVMSFPLLGGGWYHSEWVKSGPTNKRANASVHDFMPSCEDWSFPFSIVTSHPSILPSHHSNRLKQSPWNLAIHQFHGPQAHSSRPPRLVEPIGICFPSRWLLLWFMLLARSCTSDLVRCMSCITNETQPSIYYR